MFFNTKIRTLNDSVKNGPAIICCSDFGAIISLIVNKAGKSHKNIFMIDQLL